MRKLWGVIDDFWFQPIDARVYSLVRIGFAIVALLNLIDLWPDRHSFLAETGMVDLAESINDRNGTPYVSVFQYATSESAVTTVFVIAAIALVCLGLGIAPRTAAIVAFIWHLSYTHRAIPVLHGWDYVLRLMSFLIMISPMGDAWRVGRFRFTRPKSATKGLTESELPRYGLVLIQIQLCVIYWQTVWMKIGDVYWRNGEFFSYFMMSSYSGFPSRQWANWQMLSCVMTYGTLVAEITIPVLLIFRSTRWWGLAIGFSLHLGILVTSILWLFSLVILVPYLAFLDRNDVNRMTRFLHRFALGSNPD